jgi:hypothetical protein
MNKPVWISATALAAGLVCLLLPRALAAETTAKYDGKVAYAKRKAISFPDFTLTYEGVREVSPPAGLRAWKMHDFVVETEGKGQKVSWSSGTGDIGPTTFNVNGKKYLLELAISDTLGKLKEGELVVRRTK